jgi:hypothetical protein
MMTNPGARVARAASAAALVHAFDQGRHGCRFLERSMRHRARVPRRPVPHAPWLEQRVHRGEPLLLGWCAPEDGDSVLLISRTEVDGERIVHLRMYLHAPEVLAEICCEIRVPFRPSRHRYWW